MGFKFFALVVVAVLAAASADAAPTARFTPRKIQGNTCVAPCAVHFDAIGDGGNETSDPVFTREFHSLLYRWDFGDPASGVWSVTGLSKNRAVGAIAGHVYENPGTYTIRLEVENPAGEVNATTRTVTVADANATFSAANTYCFANSAGNWAGCPLNCAGGDDNCTVTSSWDRLISAGDNCSGSSDCANVASAQSRILLRRGDRFTGSSGRFGGNTSSPGLVGAFGSGAPPLIDVSRNDWGTGWTITGVDLRGGQTIVLGNTIDNVTFYRLNVTFSQTCMEEWNTGGYTRSGRQHAYVEMNCTGTGQSEYSAWPGASYVIWMGGTFNKNGGGSSSLRSSHMQHYLIQHTRWMNAAPGREHWQFRAFDEYASSVSLADMANRFVLLSDNIVENPASNSFFTVRVCVDSGCNCSEGAVGCGGAGIGAGRIVNVADFIFERNFFKYMPSGGQIADRMGVFELQGGDFTLRNNVVDYQGALNNGDTAFVVATGQPREHSSGSTVSNNYHIHNNTIYTDRSYPGRFSFATTRGSLGSGCTGGCFSRNNLFYAPNMTGSIVDHSSFTRSNNLLLRSNPFVSSIPGQGNTTKENFRIGTNSASSSVVDAGYTFNPASDRDVSLFDDVFGNCRTRQTTGMVDIGAHERNAASCPGGGSTPTALAPPTLLDP